MVTIGQIVKMENVSDLDGLPYYIRYVVEDIYRHFTETGYVNYYAVCRSVNGGYKKCFSKFDFVKRGYDRM